MRYFGYGLIFSGMLCAVIIGICDGVESMRNFMAVDSAFIIAGAILTLSNQDD